MMLVQSYGGSVHVDSCYSLKGRELYLRFGEIPDDEVATFVKVRKLEACKSCLRGVLNG